MSNYLNYKGYKGDIKYSEEDDVFHGKVIGIKSLLSFEGDSVASLKSDFRSAVDEYIEHCSKIGKDTEKPFKGSFNVRIDSDLHQKAVVTAATNGISLNSFVEEAIRKSVL